MNPVFAGMFSGAILDHYGCRCGGILSSVCQFLALGLASLAPNLVLLYLTHGVLFGECTYIPVQIFEPG